MNSHADVCSVVSTSRGFPFRIPFETAHSYTRSALGRTYFSSPFWHSGPLEEQLGGSSLPGRSVPLITVCKQLMCWKAITEGAT